MKKIIASGLCILFLISQSNAQITRGNWLFGGNGSYTAETLSSDLGDKQNFRTIEIQGTAGYFVANRLAVGIRPDVLFSATDTRFETLKSRHYYIGPFSRYYFLPEERMTNFFADAGYSFGRIGTDRQNSFSTSTYSIGAGPAIFLNSAVALEIMIGYRHISYDNGINTKRKNVQVRVGLQFHLEKD